MITAHNVAASLVILAVISRNQRPDKLVCLYKHATRFNKRALQDVHLEIAQEERTFVTPK